MVPPTFLLLISFFLPSSFGQYTFCYIKDLSREPDRFINIHTLYTHTKNLCYFHCGGVESDRATPSCHQPNQSVLPGAVIRETLTPF